MRFKRTINVYSDIRNGRMASNEGKHSIKIILHESVSHYNNYYI